MHSSRQKLFTLGAAAALMVAIGCGQQAPQETPGPETITTHGSVSVKWEKDLPSALERAGSEGKPVLVNFYADWCVWCKRLESTTLRDAQVMALLQDQVVPLSLDVDRDGKELSNTYQVDGLPTILVLNSEGQEIGRIPGYMPPAGFLEQIEMLYSAELNKEFGIRNSEFGISSHPSQEFLVFGFEFLVSSFHRIAGEFNAEAQSLFLTRTSQGRR